VPTHRRPPHCCDGRAKQARPPRSPGASVSSRRWAIRLERQAGSGPEEYNTRMGGVAGKSVAVLVVTGPQRERLYARFRRLYAGHTDVHVVLDRREGERRGAERYVATERRRGARRASAPWLVFPPSDSVE